MEAKNNKIDHPYIQSVTLNGKPYAKLILKACRDHERIETGI